MSEILLLILLTFAPFLELRASIPYGLLNTDLGMGWVLLIAVLANIVLASVLYLFFNYVIHLFLRVEKINRLYNHFVVRAQRKIHPYVEKYGIIGLALFIGIPLPGSGVYMGALGAYLLGYEFKEFMLAAVVGVVIAAAAVTAIVLTGSGFWSWLIKV